MAHTAIPAHVADQTSNNGIYLGNTSTWYDWDTLEGMGQAIGRTAPLWNVTAESAALRWVREVVGAYKHLTNGPSDRITIDGAMVNGRTYTWDHLEQMAKKYRMASHPRRYGNNDDRLQAAQALVAYDLGAQQGERIMKDKQAGRPLGSDGAYPDGVVVEGKVYQWNDLHKWAKEFGVDSDDPELEDSLTWARAVLNARANQPLSGTKKVVREVRVGKGILAGGKKTPMPNTISEGGATIGGTLYPWDQIEEWGDALGVTDPCSTNEAATLVYAEQVVDAHMRAQQNEQAKKVKPRERRLTNREKMDRADWANPIEENAPWWRYLRGFIVDGTVLCAPCYVRGGADDRYSDEATIPLVMTSPTNAGVYDFWHDKCSMCERPIAPTVAD